MDEAALVGRLWAQITIVIRAWRRPRIIVSHAGRQDAESVSTAREPAERVPARIVEITEHFSRFANHEDGTLHFNNAVVFEFVIQRL